MKKFYNWFIANKANNYHPHALRPIGLTIFLAFYLLLPALYNVTSAQQFQVLGYATNVTVGDLHTLSNQQRNANGVAALTLNSQLNSAATAKANDMIAKNYWAHNAPDGTTPWAFIGASGYSYTVAGENLAKDFNTSSGVVTGWMNSAGHRANILNGSYYDVGYGVVNGVLLGSETTLVVAMYAAKNAPAPAPAPAPPPAAAVSNPAPTPPPATAPAESNPAPTEPVESVTKSSEELSKKSKTEQASDQSAATSKQISDNYSNGSFASITESPPVKAYTSFNWSQKASILILSTLILLFVMKHTVIWRQQSRGASHIWLRSHPLAQASMLLAVLIVTIASGAGTII